MNKEHNKNQGSSALLKKAELLTGRDFWCSRADEENGIPSVRFADGPHGLRVQPGAADNFGLERSHPSTCFPTLAALACSWDVSLVQTVGEMLGQEAAHFGVNVLLGPGANIKRNPLCGRNFEYFSEDGYLAGELAAAYISGVQSTGTAACVKHFCCNSREWARTVYSAEISERALREVYLYPFERAVKKGKVAAVMTAYNKVNGVYCSENENAISGILRGEWGFDGIVVSDWVGTSDRVAGVTAGEDLEMPRCNFTAEEIAEAVRSGRLDERKIDECNARLAKFAKRYSRPHGGGYDREEHLAFARRAAENCAVLLKNDGVLPLAAGEEIAVIGGLAEHPHIQGGGSSRVNSAHTDDVLACLSQKFKVKFGRGYRADGKYSKKLAKRALAAAEGAKHVVYFMGLSDREDAEGADRQTLSLPACQLKLLSQLYSAGVRPIVVLCAGSAVDCSWDDMASAVLYMPLTGGGTGGAAADILCGKVNPSGKLAQTFPVSYADVPCSGSYAADPYLCRYEEDIFVGYRYYDMADVEVKYPFGHGLSYAKFEYSDLSCSDGKISFKLKNTGAYAGAETVQLYLCPPDCGVAMPKKTLAAFKKVWLGAGEETTVTLVPERDVLRVYDTERKKFVVFGGKYGAEAGASSRDIRLFGEVKIAGESPLLSGGGAYAEKIIAAAKASSAKDCGNGRPENGGRREINMSSPLIELKDAKGAAGRLIYKIADLYCTGKKQTALLTFRYITVRSAMQYAGFNLAQAHGFVDACNGRFFKGLKKIITKREDKK